MARDAFADLDEAGALAEAETEGTIPKEEAPAETAPPAEDEPQLETAEETTAEETLPEEEEVPPEPTDDTPKTVPYDRFEEMVGRVHRAEGQVDELTRRALRDEKPEPVEPEPEIDSDVAALIGPVIAKAIKPLEDARQKQADKDEQEQQLQAALTSAEEMMPGFGDLYPEVQKRFDAMPDDKRAVMDNLAGAITIAHQIKAEQTGEQPAAQTGLKSLKKRAHSETTPNPPRKDSGVTEQQIKAMSDKEFAAYVEGLEDSQHKQTDGIDPMIR